MLKRISTYQSFDDHLRACPSRILRRVRFTCPVFNRLFSGDPEPGRSAWDQLSEEEQRVIAPYLFEEGETKCLTT
jgi:hypothetical protein